MLALFSNEKSFVEAVLPGINKRKREIDSNHL